MAIILITGGAGNIGSALTSILAKDTDNLIVVFDDLSTGEFAKVPKRENVVFIKGDANKYENLLEVFSTYSFDFVFHYAAVVGVKRTLEYPIKVLNDIEGIKNILLLSKNTKVKRVFYSSSSEVYGEPVEIPQNEMTTPLNSRLPYAIVKNIGEAFFRSYYQEYGLEYTIFRFFNTYGPHQSEDFVIPRFLKLALNNKPIKIYGDGSQTRTFCYVDDNIETCIKVLLSSKSTNDVLNVGSAIELSVLNLAKHIIKFTNSKSEIVHVPALKEGDMTRRCPNNDKMKSILNRALITLDEGLIKMISYYENR